MKVLVPLDGSEYSYRIFSTVRRLIAVQPDVEVHLLAVLDPKSVRGKTEHAITEAPTAGIGKLNVSTPLPRLVESHGEAMERVGLESRRTLEEVADREIPAVPATVHTTWSDHPAQAINHSAEELDADVIVMATHGRSGLSHALAGSVTEAVIRTSRRPVLVQGPAVS